MHNAPSVVYPVGRCRFYGVLLLALGWLALAVLLLETEPWRLNAASSLDGRGLGLQVLAGVPGYVLWLAWSGFAAFGWYRSPVGQLHWDALASRAGTEATGTWRWRSTAYREGTALQQVWVALDLQSRMLLRLSNTDAAHVWVWVEQVRDPLRWLDLRRALVATRA
jgi:hypothetical protein